MGAKAKPNNWWVLPVYLSLLVAVIVAPWQKWFDEVDASGFFETNHATRIVRQCVYVHVLFGQGPPAEHPLWEYLIVTLLMSPIVYTFFATFMSLLTGEIYNRPVRRDVKISIKSVAMSSPMIAVWQKYLFEQKIGHIFYSWEGVDVQNIVLTTLAYYLIYDTVFYWTHRSMHLPGFYYFHQIHHSFRPPSSYSATGAHVVELWFNAYPSQFAPALFVPMHAKFFLGIIILSVLWSASQHNDSEWAAPWPIYDARLHSTHHYYGQKNYNYGFMLTWWDQICGTYRAGYKGPKSKPIVGWDWWWEKSDAARKSDIQKHAAKDSNAFFDEAPGTNGRAAANGNGKARSAKAH